MRTYKRQISLNEVKASFYQTGYVDWHINPRLGDSQTDAPDGDLAVKTAPPELKRPPLYAVVLTRIKASTPLCCRFNER